MKKEWPALTRQIQGKNRCAAMMTREGKRRAKKVLEMEEMEFDCAREITELEDRLKHLCPVDGRDGV